MSFRSAAAVAAVVVVFAPLIGPPGLLVGSSVADAAPPALGYISTVVGNGTFGYRGDSGPANSAEVGNPNGVAVDGAGNLLIVDTFNNVVRMVAATTCSSSCGYGLGATTAGDIYTVVGNGTLGYGGDSGPASSAELRLPNGVAVDRAGNLLIVDSSNNVVRMVAATTCSSSCGYGLGATTAGDIYTVVGNGTFGYGGDSGPANSAELRYPNGVAVDRAGNLLIVDTFNNVVRMVAATTCSSSCGYGLGATTAGDIYTVVGNGTFGYGGDSGPASSAELGHPNGVAVDGAGNLLIVDSSNNVVRDVGGWIAPTITNLPAYPSYGTSFTATVSTSGDGLTSVTSGTPGVCKVSAQGVVSFVGVGICTLVAHVAAGLVSSSADGIPQSFVVSTAYPYHSLAPTRICDTRAVGTGISANQCNHSGASAGTLGAGSTANVTVAGANGVPANATAVMLNVTVTNTTAASHLTAYPNGVSLPNASNLNWNAGVTIPNLVEVPVGSNGQVSLYNAAGQTDVIVDVEGYVGPAAASGAGLYNPLTPSRICDTRTVGSAIASNQCDSARSQTLQAGTTTAIQVDGLGGVPSSGVSAVALNVTVTNTTAASHLTAFPNGVSLPNASNLNWTTGETIPNRVVVPVGSNGKIDLYNASGQADVIVDVAGWFTDSSNPSATGSLYVPIAPTRICDTRAAGTEVSVNQCQSAGGTPGSLGASAIKVVQVSGGISGVPVGATAVALNVTVTNTTASSFLTAYPNGVTQPNASDLNWSPGITIPNLVIATLPSNGAVNLFNAWGTTDSIVDVEGYYVASS